MRRYTVTDTPVLIYSPLFECSFHFPDFQLAVFGFPLFPNRSESKNFSVLLHDWLLITQRCPPCCDLYASQISVLAIFLSPFFFFFMSTPDNHPSSLARFKRSKTVKVQKFPLFKRTEQNPFISSWAYCDNCQNLLAPDNAQSHAFKTFP